MERVSIGIIGGSGLYQMAGLTEAQEVAVDTPFGKPSDNFIVGNIEGKRVAFLARHGRGHRILPSELNFRANIFAMKKLGVASVEGDLLPLMANLRYVKDVIAAPRRAAGGA